MDFTVSPRRSTRWKVVLEGGHGGCLEYTVLEVGSVIHVPPSICVDI